MKRIISFITVLSLLAAALAMAMMPVAAETNYDDNLISWYNFEGATADEAKADKAQKGTAENLTIGGTASVANGVGTVLDDPGSYIGIPNKNDFNDLNGKTLYFSYRITGDSTSTSTVNVIFVRNLFRYWLGANSNATTYKGHGGGTGSAPTKAPGKFNFTGAPETLAADGWVHIAASFVYDSTNITIKVYFSADGVNYAENVFEVPLTANVADKVSATIVLGKPSTGKTSSNGSPITSGGVDLEYREIRLYDTVLSSTAVSGLAAHTPYEGDVTPEPDPEPELPTITPVKGLFDANLVTYYNFEGATAEEQFADKAPNGLTNDVLDVSANVTVSNGVATIPSAKGEYLAIDALEGDTADLAGKTLFIAYTTSGNAVQYATDLISANKVFRYWLAKGTTDSNYVMGGGIGSAPTKEGKFLNLGTAPKAPLGEWYYTAITIDMSNDQLVITCYNSADGVNYVAAETVYTDDAKPENLLRNVSLVIGKNTKVIDDRGLSFKVDEFRVYDRVMTADEVSRLTAAAPSAEAVRVLGWQEKTNANNLLDVRFLAHLNVTEADLSRYTAVGFEISANYKGVDKATKTVRCTTVYNSITADGQAITVAIYNQVDGYIIALPVYNVPVDDTVTFTVRPFYEMNGEIVYGETATAVYTNGVAAE